MTVICASIAASAVLDFPHDERTNQGGALDRVLTWPAEAQQEALASLEIIEEELVGSHELTADDQEALAKSSDDVRHGRFASDAEVREVFDRYRPK